MSNQDVKFKIFHCPGLPRYFIGDADRIQQLMLNLLSITCKFLPMSKGLIRIETSYLISPEELLQVSVGNNGRRIPYDA